MSDIHLSHRYQAIVHPSTSQMPADYVSVGSKDILKSDQVVEAPPDINRPVPVPSLYCDSRGEIHNLLVGNKRINLLYTKAGVKRSGDLHAQVQHDFVFSGKVVVSILTRDGTTHDEIYGAGMYISIPPYVPHVFTFLQDTTMAEWWDGPFFAWLFLPYRKIVEESSTDVKRPGRFSHYVVRSEWESSSFLQPQWWAGLLVGVTVGFLLARRR
jgi:hypothetical protein